VPRNEVTFNLHPTVYRFFKKLSLGRTKAETLKSLLLEVASDCIARDAVNVGKATEKIVPRKDSVLKVNVDEEAARILDAFGGHTSVLNFVLLYRMLNLK